MSGRFITFEGIDGAGKSTHIGWFTERLRQELAARAGANAAPAVVVTREPGGTTLGEALRELLLHQAMHLETEALLMFAARREHLARVIEPALARGDWVLSDRFTDASFAYQGGGRGLALEKLETLERWVHPHLQPNRTLLFDVPTEVARERLRNAREPDKFERENLAFFENVRNEYLRRAAEHPGRFIVIDGTQPVDSIRKLLQELISSI